VVAQRAATTVRLFMVVSFAAMTLLAGFTPAVFVWFMRLKPFGALEAATSGLVGLLL